MSLYGYVAGDPVNFVDPKGLSYEGMFPSFSDIFTQFPPVTSPIAAPNSYSACENIRSAKNHRYQVFWFYNQVKNKAPWDYKQLNGDYADLGNFNYGMTGSAVGFPEAILLRMAGWAQRQAGTSKSEWGTPYDLGPSSYGDDPEDQAMILRGINFYRENSCECK